MPDRTNHRAIEWTQAAETECRTLAELALAEDVANGVDCTTQAIVDPLASGKANFVARENGVVCGLRPAEFVIHLFSDQLSLDVRIGDGGRVEQGSIIATLHGPAADILTVERTCLNFMGRLSGISSLASRFVAEVTGTKAQVLDTRKTTPAWRHLEKYAVSCGGANNHRIGLFDAILIKDNHLAFAAKQIDGLKAIDWAVQRSRKWIEDNAQMLPRGKSTIVQIEVDRLDQLESALRLPVDIILLDNMTNEELVHAVAMRGEIAKDILLEASGGVSIDTVGDIARTGVDRISAGALTHSAVNFDIGLDWC